MIQEEVRIAGAGGAAGGDDGPDEVQPEPLDMAFPRSGIRKQLTYLILFPLIFPLWLTLPDTRAQKSKFKFDYFDLTNLFFLSLSLLFSKFSKFEIETKTKTKWKRHQFGPPIIEEENEAPPLDMSWPGTFRERVTYVAVLPILLPLWMTLPDTRKESSKEIGLELKWKSDRVKPSQMGLNIFLSTFSWKQASKRLCQTKQFLFLLYWTFCFRTAWFWQTLCFQLVST